MATVINNPSDRVVERERITDNNGSDSAGWAVAVIILIAVVALGAYLWTQAQGGTPEAPSGTGGTNIEVTVPTSGPTGANGTGASTSSFTGSLSDSPTASNTRSGGY
jgi:hypothetical protein